MKWQLANPNLIQTGILIDGHWLTEERPTFAVTNPANGQIIAEVATATPRDLELAVISASGAMEKWRQIPAKERSQILRCWYQLIIEHRADLAQILTLEQGKPLVEASSEIMYAASYFEWYAEEAKRVYGSLIPANLPGQQISVQLEPIGVCAAITPWNFPSAMLARKVAPALAAGCSMLAKPASLTPLSANALAYLGLAAGIPPGLLNILHGHSGKIGEFLCHAMAIRKLSFTGSTEVGVWLYQNCANSMKKLSLELGGNAPLIVCADADLELAVNAIMQSKFRNSGQTCVCANRILVDKSIKPQLLARLVARVSQLQVGDGLQATTTLGPVIDDKALIHLQSLVADALAHGASLVSGGRRLSELGPQFFAPTVLDCPTTELRLFKEEIFGPIAAIYTFTSQEQALALANATDYGLASYVFSQNLNTINYFSSNLACGMVGINTGLISAENVPFGGVKMSGLGREGGKQGIEEYLVSKYINQAF